MKLFSVFLVLVCFFSCSQDKDLKTLKGCLYNNPLPLLISNSNAKPYILLNNKGELLELKYDEIAGKVYELKGKLKYKDGFQLFVVFNRISTKLNCIPKKRKTLDMGQFKNYGTINSFKCSVFEHCIDKKTIEKDNFAFVTFESSLGVRKSLIIGGKRGSSIYKKANEKEGIIEVNGNLIEIYGMKYLFIEGENNSIEKRNIPKNKKTKKRTQ